MDAESKELQERRQQVISQYTDHCKAWETFAAKRTAYHAEEVKLHETHMANTPSPTTPTATAAPAGAALTTAAPDMDARIAAFQLDMEAKLEATVKEIKNQNANSLSFKVFHILVMF